MNTGVAGQRRQNQASLLEPKKPENVDGTRDQFVVQSRLYQVKQYIALVQVGTNAPQVDEATKISFASSFLTGTSANGWYTVVAGSRTPVTREESEGAIWNEFIPFDSVQREREKLRRLVQRTSVSEYLFEFRKIVLMIPGVNEGEQLDRFFHGLKRHIRLEVLRAGARSMDEAARIALNVASALLGAGCFRFKLKDVSIFINALMDRHLTPVKIVKYRGAKESVWKRFFSQKGLSEQRLLHMP